MNKYEEKIKNLRIVKKIEAVKASLKPFDELAIELINKLPRKVVVNTKKNTYLEEYFFMENWRSLGEIMDYIYEPAYINLETVQDLTNTLELTTQERVLEKVK